jgi:hypothetical protein
MSERASDDTTIERRRLGRVGDSRWFVAQIADQVKAWRRT